MAFYIDQLVITDKIETSCRAINEYLTWIMTEAIHA